MTTGFIPSPSQPTPAKDGSKIHLQKDEPGKITATIGRGDDARNSFVYLTLKWAFIVGSGISVLVVIDKWMFEKQPAVPDIISDIVTTWEIVIPLITLALGYAFGKSKD